MMNAVSGLLAIGFTAGLLWVSPPAKADASQPDSQTSSVLTLANPGAVATSLDASPRDLIKPPALPPASVVAQTDQASTEKSSPSTPATPPAASVRVPMMSRIFPAPSMMQ